MSLTKEPQNVSALAEKFDMTRQAVSLHIKYLSECGVVVMKKKGRERYGHLQVEKLKEVAHWLEPFEHMWSGKLAKLDMLLDDMQKKTKLKTDNQ